MEDMVALYGYRAVVAHMTANCACSHLVHSDPPVPRLPPAMRARNAPHSMGHPMTDRMTVGTDARRRRGPVSPACPGARTAAAHGEIARRTLEANASEASAVKANRPAATCLVNADQGGRLNANRLGYRSEIWRDGDNSSLAYKRNTLITSHSRKSLNNVKPIGGTFIAYLELGRLTG